MCERPAGVAAVGGKDVACTASHSEVIAVRLKCCFAPVKLCILLLGPLSLLLMLAHLHQHILYSPCSLFLIWAGECCEYCHPRGCTWFTCRTLLYRRICCCLAVLVSAPHAQESLCTTVEVSAVQCGTRPSHSLMPGKITDISS